MVRVCHEQGVALSINCSRRWNPFYSEARGMIESGELGEVLQVTSQFRAPMGNVASHLTDTIRYLAGGNVTWVFGEMESDEAAASDGDILGNGYLAFDNGARAFIRGMSSGDISGWDIEVICEKGRMRFREEPPQFDLTRLGAVAPYGRGFRSTDSMDAALPATYPIPMPHRMEGMGLTIVNDLIDAFETGRPPKCSGEDGLAALEVAIALRESHRRGGVKVPLPLEDRSLRIEFNDTFNDHIPNRIRRLSGMEAPVR
jgi:predicted dehydrogenase